MSPENKVEITVSMLVDPDFAGSEQLERYAETQRALAALVGGKDIVVSFSFPTPELPPRELLDRKLADHIQSGPGTTAIGTKQLIGGLKTSGLTEFRSVIAVGTEVMNHHVGKGTFFGQFRIDRIQDTLSGFGLKMPEKTSVEQVALVCDNLEQVPGHVLWPAIIARQVQHGRGDSSQLSNAELWRQGVLNQNISALMGLPLEDLAAAIRNSNAEERLTEERGLESAQALKDLLQKYASDFLTHKASSPTR